MTAEWRLRLRRVDRIGVTRLWQHATEPTRWAVSLDNRTYHQFYEILPDRVAAWHKLVGFHDQNPR